MNVYTQFDLISQFMATLLINTPLCNQKGRYTLSLLLCYVTSPLNALTVQLTVTFFNSCRLLKAYGRLQKLQFINEFLMLKL